MPDAYPCERATTLATLWSGGAYLPVNAPPTAPGIHDGGSDLMTWQMSAGMGAARASLDGLATAST
jgi:hypothetical protein